MGKKKEIFGFYKDIIDVNQESIIKLSSNMIASIIYLLPINKSKNAKAPSYRKGINKSVIYSEIKTILEIKKEILINENKKYNVKKISQIDRNTIYIKYNSGAYLDVFNESLRNAFAHGNIYKKNDTIIIFNVDNGCKRIKLYFETTEDKLRYLIDYYKEKVCANDEKVKLY